MPPYRQQVLSRRFGVLALLLSLGASCLRAEDLQTVSLQLKYYHQFQFAGYYAADLKGFYAQQGLAVTIKEYQPGLDIDADIIQGTSDFAVTSTLPFTEWEHGQDIFLVAVIFQRSPFQLLVHAESPYQSVRDIISLPKDQLAGPVACLESELRVSLKSLGVDPDTFFTKPKEPGDFQRFCEHKISVLSAYSTNEQQKLLHLGVPTRPLRMLTRDAFFPGDQIICQGALWRAHPDQVERFRRASLEGWTYALNHPQELIDHILARRQSRGQVLERAHLEEEAAAVYDLVDPDRFPLGEITPDRLKHIATLLRNTGQQAEVPVKLIYQAPVPTDRWIIALGVVLAVSIVGVTAIVLLSYRQQRFLSETQVHYHNLVNCADGYVAFRLRMVPGLLPYPEMASESIKQILGQDLLYYQQDCSRFFSQVHDEDRQRLEQELGAVTNLRPLRCRFRLRTPQHAGLRHLMMHATPTQTERGLFLDGILLDLSAEVEAESERQHLQQQLQMSQRHESLGLLASGIAHDFNNILCAIRGNAEFLNPMIPERGQHRLRRLYQAVDRASGLVRQILAYAGRGTVESRPLDLGEEITQLDELVKHALPSTTSTVLQISPGMPPVLCDPAQFQQVAINLVVNAAESYQGRTGVVSVTLDLFEEMVRLRVSDAGSGMDPSTQARIFEPYFTTKEFGHGLGLAAVRGIISGLGGTITCESKVAVGTTFTIMFKPCASSKPRTSYRSPAPQPITEQFVLVADDDELVREITIEMLTALGYRCKQAAGGRDCQRILTEERESLFALVVDCRMPDLDGMTICKQLRANGDRLPVVLISGMINDSASVQDGSDSRTRFLAKPFTHNQLAAVFDAMFSDKRQRQRNDDGSSAIALMVTDVIRQRQEEEQRRTPSEP